MLLTKIVICRNSNFYVGFFFLKNIDKRKIAIQNIFDIRKVICQILAIYIIVSYLLYGVVNIYS